MFKAIKLLPLFTLLSAFTISIAAPGLQPKGKLQSSNALPTESLSEKFKKSKRKNKIDPYFDKKGNAKLIDRDFKEMTFDELKHNKGYHEKNKEPKETIIHYVERMIVVSKDEAKIRELRLENADLYFDLGRFDKALTIYNDFVKAYPGNEKAEYAAYKAILSRFSMMLPYDRSQEQTKDTLKAAKEFINNNSYTKHVKEVKNIIEQCNERLLQSELKVYNFYLFRGKIRSAEKRLKCIKSQYLENKKYAYLVDDLDEQLKAAKSGKEYTPKYEIENIGKPAKPKVNYALRF